MYRLKTIYHDDRKDVQDAIGRKDWGALLSLLSRVSRYDPEACGEFYPLIPMDDIADAPRMAILTLLLSCQVRVSLPQSLVDRAVDVQWLNLVGNACAFDSELRRRAQTRLTEVSIRHAFAGTKERELIGFFVCNAFWDAKSFDQPELISDSLRNSTLARQSLEFVRRTRCPVDTELVLFSLRKEPISCVRALVALGRVEDEVVRTAMKQLPVMPRYARAVYEYLVAAPANKPRFQHWSNPQLVHKIRSPLLKNASKLQLLYNS